MIEYCKYHVDARKKTDADKLSKLDDDVKAWDMEFVKVDQGTLFELILVSALGQKGGQRDARLWQLSGECAGVYSLLRGVQAANYLNIKSLLDLTCLTVANMIKGKTPEEIRKTFNIKV